MKHDLGPLSAQICVILHISNDLTGRSMGPVRRQKTATITESRASNCASYMALSRQGNDPGGHQKHCRLPRPVWKCMQRDIGVQYLELLLPLSSQGLHSCMFRTDASLTS